MALPLLYATVFLTFASLPSAQLAQSKPSNLTDFRLSSAEPQPSSSSAVATTVTTPLNLKFEIKADQERPWSTLQLFYTSETAAQLLSKDISEFWFNYSDVSTDSAPASNLTKSGGVQLDFRQPAPAKLDGLLAGHSYLVVVAAAKPVIRSLHSQLVQIAPKAPRFDAQRFTVTTNSIWMRGEIDTAALQDHFTVVYFALAENGIGQTAPSRLRVNSAAGQHWLDVRLANLSPGRDYDVTVFAEIKNRQTKGVPWHRIVSTKPLPPKLVEAFDVNTSAVRLQWTPDATSGFDVFVVKYWPVEEPKSEGVMVTDIDKSFVVLSEELFPGETYSFEVFTTKGVEVSESASLIHTLMPLPPRKLTVTPSFSDLDFKVLLELPPADVSKADECSLEIISNHGNFIMPIQNNTAVRPADKRHQFMSCTFHVPLVAGQRYALAGRTNSGRRQSVVLRESATIRPAFSFEKFGLTVGSASANSLQVRWPQDENNLEEVRKMWANLVKNDSVLLAKLEESGAEAEGNMTAFEERGSPFSDDEPISFDNLPRGSCYSLLLHTVTSSGVPSGNRRKQQLRLDPPSGTVSLSSKGPFSAKVSVKFSRPSSTNVSEHCRLHLSAVARSDGRGLPVSLSHVIDTTEVKFDLERLNPYTMYTAEARVVCVGGACATGEKGLGSVEFRTDEFLPGPVAEAYVRAENPNSVLIGWMPPAETNGRIRGYRVRVTPVESPIGEAPRSERFGHEHGLEQVQVARISKLTGGLVYRFDIAAETGAGFGQEVDAVVQKEPPETLANLVRMPIKAPPNPRSAPEVLSKTIRTNDFSIRFSATEMFSTDNGLLEKYSVVVAEQRGDLPPVLPADGRLYAWKDVSEMEVWPPYAAVSRPLSGTSKAVEAKVMTEVVGVDVECSTRFCNGPLRPNTPYFVFVRVYTNATLFSDSPLSQLVRTEAAAAAGSGRGAAVGSASKILLFVFALLVLLLFGAAAALLLRRSLRRSSPPAEQSTSRQQEAKDPSGRLSRKVTRMLMAGPTADCLAKLGLSGAEPNGTAGGNNIHHRRSKSLRERTGVDGRLGRLSPTQRLSLLPLHTVLSSANRQISEERVSTRNTGNKRFSRPVKKDDFAEHVRLMSADTDFRFSEEYEDLKQVGRRQSATAADLPANRSKNRFTNILPYDHSRVKLLSADDDDGSDYINANYISGFNSPRQFIAAQGPLPSTRDDFWRMIWEQQSAAVLNLTRCVEKGREKCHQYWPDSTEPEIYGDIEVTMMNETKLADFAVREFRLTHMEEEGAAPRNLKQFHYLSWPDFGVPDRPQGLCQFVATFRAALPAAGSAKDGPTIVHCSAGVGRSGTFIALDRALQSLAAGNNTIDIFGAVYEMRKERVLMVQTEQQYIFIHRCVLCSLEHRENEEPAAAVASNLQQNATSCSSSAAAKLFRYPVGVAVDPPSPPMAGGPPRSAPLPRIEVHQNPAFVDDDDEGIAESGL